MISTVIVEDEKPAARRLQRMLEKLEVKVISTLHSVEEATEWFLRNEHPDLIFLDIQLSDGLSFEIFENTEIHSPIIFTTAYDEYALQAFKLNSIDYLLKPLDDDELAVGLEKFRKTRFSNQHEIDFKALKSLLNIPGSDYRKRFSVQVGQHIKIVNMDEVCCFYSENKGTYIYTCDNRNYLLDCSLEKLETELDPNTFFRVNRKFIIALKSIKDILNYSNTRLELKLDAFNEQQIIVSRERVKEFKHWIS